MQSKNIIRLETGDFAKSIITWIRDIRNKYNIQKEKPILYIDLWCKKPEILTFQIIEWEEIIKKYNMGNLEKVEYSLYELFEKNSFFETTQINGIGFYIPIQTIDKIEKIKEITQEINRLEIQIENCNVKLLNKTFTEKAPKEIVDNEQKKKNNFMLKMSMLKSTILQFECGKEQYDLIIKTGSQEKIDWYIQYLREKKCKEELYLENWFNEIYNEQIQSNEIKELHKILYEF